MKIRISTPPGIAETQPTTETDAPLSRDSILVVGENSLDHIDVDKDNGETPVPTDQHSAHFASLRQQKRLGQRTGRLSGPYTKRFLVSWIVQKNCFRFV